MKPRSVPSADIGLALSPDVFHSTSSPYVRTAETSHTPRLPPYIPGMPGPTGTTPHARDMKFGPALHSSIPRPTTLSSVTQKRHTDSAIPNESEQSYLRVT